jgi:2-octaprenyl-6-methoxyphenol hydroxylase
LRIGLVEAEPYGQARHPGYDDRILALAYGSMRIFQGLGLWENLGASATPIVKVHISDQGRPGIARLDAREEGVQALGYVVEAREIGSALMARLHGLPEVELLCPASLEGVSVDRDAASAWVRLGKKEVEFKARLVVAADGARSRVRQQLGVEAVRWDYRQTAVIANVTPELPHRNVAYERFTDAGPLALLPMSEGRCAVVCTVDDDARARLMGASDEGFLAELQRRFGDRLGRFQRTGLRQGYPLFMVKSRTHVRHRVAIIGNAAHTLHPIAGQGFNLGLRDVAALAEVVVDANRANDDFGDERVLQRYAHWRRWDQRGTILFTDGLTRLFGNPLAPLQVARNLGLLAFDLLPPVKRLLSRHTMGTEGRLPRLARGLALPRRQSS